MNDEQKLSNCKQQKNRKKNRIKDNKKSIYPPPGSQVGTYTSTNGGAFFISRFRSSASNSRIRSRSRPRWTNRLPHQRLHPSINAPAPSSPPLSPRPPRSHSPRFRYPTSVPWPARFPPMAYSSRPIHPADPRPCRSGSFPSQTTQFSRLHYPPSVPWLAQFLPMVYSSRPIHPADPRPCWSGSVPSQMTRVPSQMTRVPSQMTRAPRLHNPSSSS